MIATTLRSNQPFTAVGVLLLAKVFVSPGLAAIERTNDNLLLAAIAAVETGTTDLTRPCRRVGALGERSAWQFTPATWRRYTRLPFEAASRDARTANMVAMLHLQWLREHLQRAGLRATPRDLALAWNAGQAAVLADRVPVGAHDYADRVINLYQDLPSRDR